MKVNEEKLLDPHVDDAGNGSTDAARFMALLDKLHERGILDDRVSQLFEAARTGNVEKVRLLIKAGVDVHACNDVALRVASGAGHVEVVRMLLKAGADVHACDDAALRNAAAEGHVEVVRILLKAGADVHACDDEALRLAAAYGHAEVERLLLKAGADVDCLGWIEKLKLKFKLKLFSLRYIY